MAQTYTTNLSNVAFRFVQLLKIPLTKRSLTQTLVQNPFYPSLYSLKTTLEQFHIPNDAFEVTADQLENLDAPFVTYLTDTEYGKDSVLVTEIRSSTVSFIGGNNKTHTISKDEFLERWEKIVLFAEAADESGEPEFLKKQRIERQQTTKQVALYTCLGILVGLVFYRFFSLMETPLNGAIILGLKSAGMFIMLLLIIHETNRNNSLVKNICSLSKKTNCDAVLNSKAASWLGISFTEIGLFYFSATGLFLLFADLSFEARLAWLMLANCAAVPFVVFSVYYQWKVVKQWCLLCLATQCVLLSEFVFFIFSVLRKQSFFPPDTHFSTILAIGTCLLVPVTVWYLLKPLLKTAKSSPVFENEYKRQLHNPAVLKALLTAEPLAPAGWENMGILIGNPAAENTILKVCNPYCSPCSKSHFHLQELVKRNGNINVRVIFNVIDASVSNVTNSTIKHLLAIAAKHDPDLTEKALHDWYSDATKNNAAFAQKYPVSITELETQSNALLKTEPWCKEAKIQYTPTYFLNGKRLPEHYDVNVLKQVLW